ncbi:MAG TPA: TauD/TfdA family dioxygenase [Pyrinomonadaceae bacterium]|nr:TauD/TfdA family dioxygenase [Pyrinomonadaceae bacterium]
MSRPDAPEFTNSGGPTFKRKVVSLSSEALVQSSYLQGGKQFPLVLQPAVEHLNPVAWASVTAEYIERQLLKHGAILFRGFRIGGPEGFEKFIRTLSPQLLDYNERAAPRIKVADNIYTSTEYPADQYIPLHHEMSYSHNWPMKIWFYCVQPAAKGGSTPIACDREFMRRLDPLIKETFLSKGVMYVRNYGQGLDLSWQDAFQTQDKSDVEEYCRRAGTHFEWKDAHRLRTRQVRQVVTTHPKTEETIWFNHAHMFHVSNLEPAVRDSLLAEFKGDDLPRNAYYGDGSPIESSVLKTIRSTYQQIAVTFTWQKGDLLMLDNVLASHGREPFTGPRKILVAMAELFSHS